ncbi:MAG: ribonuclease P protein component [Nitrospirae bacterium]|nr:ribonuclease P protein component [Nitrospirota bacterium]
MSNAVTLTIPKNEQIKRTFEYKRVYEKGKRYYSSNIILYVLNNDLQYSRVGISVGKKVGGSVKRNRIKRLLREILRHIWGRVIKERDIVVVAKKDALERDLKALWQDLEGLFKKAGLIENKNR